MSQRKTPRSGPALNPIKKTPAPQIRNADADEAATAKDIALDALNRLANLPKPATPIQRASSAGPSSGRRVPKTPARANVPNTRFLGSARRPVATTPHGRAAQREIEARRAGFTPGKDRRKSGKQQRETPRDDLRALSRLLAPKSKPIIRTPEKIRPAQRKFRNDDLLDDDGPTLERPRLSLPIGEEDEDEDDSLLLPPRSAGLEDENFTVQSVELPRRAVSELPPGRLSRGSFGSIRMSDQFGDLNELGGGHGFDSSFALARDFEDEDIVDDDLPEENTVTLRAVGLQSGRDSDIRGVLPGDDTENDFVFNVPAREVQDNLNNDEFADLDVGIPAVSSPPRQIQQILMSEIGSDNWEEIEDPTNGLIFEDNEKTAGLAVINDAGHRDTTMYDETMDGSSALPKIVKKKKIKVTKHGIQYPSLPVGVVKKLATTYARTTGHSKAKLSKDTMTAIMQATDWFFEQVSEDLGAYAEHAGRKTIDESDVVTLMKRQRQINATTTPFSLAHKFLPRELLQELRMVPPSKLKRGRHLEQVEEIEED